MTSRSLSVRARLAALLVPLAVGPGAAGLHAQTPPAYPAIADVDPVAALSRYLRMLAANPRDLASLTGAGRAALAVGDANAALGFYARAEEIAPRNGRIKAGLASALVQMEQPRTALKLFDEAVALGVPVGEIASDRGLANDLNGDNRRAQADYTLALRAKDDDEVLRRLALSMAISGDRAGALTMLDPLLRKHDSGAVRARAFVLALTGDQAGAANAVRGAMPGPQASVMANFMSRLGKLNPAQKALAVNFGYFPSDGRSYSAAELFADARSGIPPVAGSALPARDPRSDRRADTPLIPAGEALGPAIVTASNDATARAPRRRPGQPDAAEILPPQHVLSAPIPGRTAPPATVPTRTSLAPAPVAPVSPARPVAETGIDSRAGVTPPAGAASGVAGAGPAVATASPAARTVPPIAAGSTAAQAAPAEPLVAAPAPPATAPTAPVPISPPHGDAAVAAASPPPAAPVESPAAAGALVITAVGPALAGDPAPPPQAAAPMPVAAPPVATAVEPAPRPKLQLALRDEPAAPKRAVKKGGADEAGASAPPAKSKAVEKAYVKAKGGKADAREEADDKPGKDKKTKAEPKDKAASKPADREKTRDAALDKEAKGSDAKKGDKTKTADKSRSGKDKADRDKSDKDKTGDKKSADKTKGGTKSADKADGKPTAKSKIPERYWVQVASGSNKANLDKAWDAVKGKAPKLLNGKSTYTAPWHASNRLLIGPFKTDEEAQAQVNKLAKSGVSGIQFTTRAGNDVEKVTAR